MQHVNARPCAHLPDAPAAPPPPSCARLSPVVYACMPSLSPLLRLAPPLPANGECTGHGLHGAGATATETQHPGVGASYWRAPRTVDRKAGLVKSAGDRYPPAGTVCLFHTPPLLLAVALAWRGTSLRCVPSTACASPRGPAAVPRAHRRRAGVRAAASTHTRRAAPRGGERLARWRCSCTAAPPSAWR